MQEVVLHQLDTYFVSMMSTYISCVVQYSTGWAACVLTLEDL